MWCQGRRLGWYVWLYSDLPLQLRRQILEHSWPKRLWISRLRRIQVNINLNWPHFIFSNYRYTLAGFAAVDARVILAGFDGDSNGLLDASECAAWKEFVQGHMSQWGWNPTADQQAAMMAAWNNAQSKLIQTSLRKIFASRSIKPYLKNNSRRRWRQHRQHGRNRKIPRWCMERFPSINK